jgi:hypothetical protein
VSPSPPPPPPPNWDRRRWVLDLVNTVRCSHCDTSPLTWDETHESEMQDRVNACQEQTISELGILYGDHLRVPL